MWFHVPEDFEMYLVPYGITPAVATMLMTLAGMDSFASLDDVSSRVLWGGNAQALPMGELLGNQRHLGLLVMASMSERVLWMTDSAYIQYKQNCVHQERRYTDMDLVNEAMRVVSLFADTVVRTHRWGLEYSALQFLPRQLYPDSRESFDGFAVEAMISACRARSSPGGSGSLLGHNRQYVRPGLEVKYSRRSQ
jgi:hypothetical protein